MKPEVGAVLEGTVTGITKFGAFVGLPGGGSGLVHISEIANEYVTDVKEYVREGQAVRVRVLAVTPDGKINLSIKAAAPAPPEHRPERRAAPQRPPSRGRGQAPAPSGPPSFEDRLKQFMQESDSRMAGNRLYSDHVKSRRRGGRRPD